MYKCLRITFQGALPEGFLRDYVQKHAKKLSLEGTAQRISGDDKTVKIIACGAKDSVEGFLDVLYKGLAAVELETMEVEPFLREKDYRGVFRVIE